MKNILFLSIILFFIQCSDNNTNLVDPAIVGQLDTEIKERINIIKQNIDLTVIGGTMNFLNPTEIDNDINLLLKNLKSEMNNDSVISQTNEYFKNSIKKYWLNDISFSAITSERDFDLVVKLNELALLDKIIFNRKNKIGNSSYQTKFIPTTQTDSTYSGEVIFLKTDTLFPSEVLVTTMNEMKDTVHLAIIGGKGTFEIGTGKRPYDFNIKGSVKCNGQFFNYEFKDVIK